MMWWEKFKTIYVTSRKVFTSAPCLDQVEPVLWKLKTKHSEMDKQKNATYTSALSAY